MKRQLLLLSFVIFIPLPLRADDSLARARFEQGVAAAAEARWEDARQLLEASLQESDKPTTRYNLVVTNTELGRTLDAARHAVAFLAFPAAPALSEAREMVKKLLDKARASLALLLIDALPPGLAPVIDGAPPQLLHEGCAYLEPGLHRLELRDAHGHVEKIVIDLAAGQTQAWPRAISENVAMPTAAPAQPVATLTPAPAAGAPTPAESPSPVSRRRKAAWTLGVSGAVLTLTSIGLYAAAETQAGRLSERGVESPGYPSAADQYGRLKLTILPIGLVGGMLMAGAVAIGPKLTRHGSLGWAISCLVAGAAMSIAGGVLLARTPDLVVRDTEIEDLTRQRGGLLVAGALPLISYGTTFLIGAKRRRQTR